MNIRREKELFHNKILNYQKCIYNDLESFFKSYKNLDSSLFYLNTFTNDSYKVSNITKDDINLLFNDIVTFNINDCFSLNKKHVIKNSNIDIVSHNRFHHDFIHCIIINFFMCDVSSEDPYIHMFIYKLEDDYFFIRTIIRTELIPHYNFNDVEHQIILDQKTELNSFFNGFIEIINKW